MLARSAVYLVRSTKRWKNDSKTASSSISKKHQEGADRKNENAMSPPFTSSSSGMMSSTHLSYLTSVFSSLWPSEEGKSKSRIKEKKIGRVKELKSSRATLTSRTQRLISGITVAETDCLIMLRTRELCHHFLEFPDTRHIALQGSLMKKLRICFRRSTDETLKEQLRQFFEIMGDINSPNAAGVRVLSIDGGGTRGMLGLDMLQALEDSLHGPKVVDVFDIIVGVSTGAIIAALLTAKRLSVEKCKEVYVEMSRDLFNQGKFWGVSGLLLSHAYYNTEKWKELLKKVVGEETLLETCRYKGTPKLSIVSCTVNTPTLQPYIFRSYGHPLNSESHYRGGCNFKLWEALQASAAAPGYFQEVSLGGFLHQDGGVLTNNPTALAIHEARTLWPDENLQCVVSVGNGRAVSELEPAGSKSSTRLQEKILRIIDSATDTELVDLCMRDILPTGSYLRFNPYTSYPYPLDEIDPEKLAQMGHDARLYIKRNQGKFDAAASLLLNTPSPRRYFKRKLKNLLTL